MPLEPFKTSDALSMGVELELQIVNTYDQDLASNASRSSAPSRPR